MCEPDMGGTALDQSDDSFASTFAELDTSLQELEASFAQLRIEVARDEAPASLSPRAVEPPTPTLEMDLPPELMAYLFTIACHDSILKFHVEKERKQMVTPFVLGSVCSEWRTIVWSTPAIWSHIALNLITSKYDRQMDLLQDYVARSGNLPLTIALIFQEENDWFSLVPHGLIEVLRTSAPRWRCVNLVLPEAWYPLLAGIKHNLPLLTTLSTQSSWHDCNQPPSKRQHLDLFADAPSLVEAHLNGYYLSDVDIPWKQLRKLKLQHVYIDECFYALSRAPRLEQCKIYTILFNDVHRSLAPQSIALRSLTYLHIYHSDWEYIDLLFSNLTAPLLRVLEFSEPLKGRLPALPTLLRKMACNLTELKLVEYQFGGTEPDLIEFVRGISSLTALHIGLAATSTAISGLFVELLGAHAEPSSAEDTETTYFLPHLKHFSFSGRLAPREGFQTELLHVLQSRTTSVSEGVSKVAVAPLFSFALEARSDGLVSAPGEEICEQFWMLIRDGLNLTVVVDGFSWV